MIIKQRMSFDAFYNALKQIMLDVRKAYKT